MTIIRSPLVPNTVVGLLACLAFAGRSRGDVNSLSPPPTPEPAPIAESSGHWRWHLVVPVLGIGRMSGTRESTPTIAHFFPVVVVNVSREIPIEGLKSPWTIEGEAGWLIEAGALVRNVVRLQTGPAFRLADYRESSGSGSTISLLTQAGVTYWSTLLSVIGEYGTYDQDLIGAIAQVGIEDVEWTSRGAGWSFRLRMVGEAFFLGRRYYLGGNNPLDRTHGWDIAAFLDFGRAW